MTFRIFGHGTLSGDFLPHPNYADPPVPPEEHYKYHHINVFSASNIFVEGITLANSPSHSLSLVGVFSNQYNWWKVLEDGWKDFVRGSKLGDGETTLWWVKVITWRANGDDIGLKKNLTLTKCIPIEIKHISICSCCNIKSTSRWPLQKKTFNPLNKSNWQADRPESNPTSIRWVKIFTWRANGDGIGLNKNTLLEGAENVLSKWFKT